MKKLYFGVRSFVRRRPRFDDINGPAPMILAMFMNTAIDQHVERFLRANGRFDAALKIVAKAHPVLPKYQGELPPGHDGAGLALLGVGGRRLVALGVLTADEYATLRAEALSRVRGTVQADILKEDQAQNTCIFSTEFALRMMGDVQQFFSDNNVKNFLLGVDQRLSHRGGRGEPGDAARVHVVEWIHHRRVLPRAWHEDRRLRAEPVVLLLEWHGCGVRGDRPRGAAHLGARRCEDVYGAGPRSQMLKYHIQTSGRSLHAREIQFNDIRTTLQAMYALFDNCNSLHTECLRRSADDADRESVRRAVAIQLIINRELGLNRSRTRGRARMRSRRCTDLVEEGRVQGVRVDRGARRRVGRDGDDVPARQDSGRKHVVRDAQARWNAAHRRREYLSC
jgi:methylmalonyl-CoA mutase